MTKLNYLNNPYLFESTSTFVELKEEDGRKAVILKETIFYPQGGGQPADTGEIVSENAVFFVEDTRLDENGTVWHFGEFEKGSFKEKEAVTLKIDKQKRILNAKLHSAGHLIDCAIEEMGIKNLKPTKGFHFPQGAYVEYEGVIENPNDIVLELENTVNDLIAKDLRLEKQDLTSKEAEERGIWSPAGKSARVVNFEGFSVCGCGGTHVNSSSEIQKINIRKIKCKKGKTKISYKL